MRSEVARPRCGRRPVLLRALGAVLALAALPAWAQSDAPTTRSLIDALKKPPADADAGTARNLFVRKKPADAAPAGADGAAGGATVAAPDAGAATGGAAVDTTVGTTGGGAGQVSLAIQFEISSARISPDSGALLANLAGALKSPELKASRFLIEGHTDASGSAAGNQALSLARAQSVRRYLGGQGVVVARLQAVGKGSSEPVNTADPRGAENRRVRIANLP